MMNGRMSDKRFALLLPRLTLPVGMEAYKATGFSVTVVAETETHQATEGSNGPCRVCLKKVFPGDRAFWVMLRRIGSCKAGRTSVLVHETCETA